VFFAFFDSDQVHLTIMVALLPLPAMLIGGQQLASRCGSMLSQRAYAHKLTLQATQQGDHAKKRSKVSF
jgi:hypothetical protein